MNESICIHLITDKIDQFLSTEMEENPEEWAKYLFSE